MSTFCSCFCRRSDWYKAKIEHMRRHDQACERLDKEIDICKLLQNQRIGLFIAKLILKKHQRALVTSFDKYQLNNLSGEPSKRVNGEQLMSSAI